MQFGRRVEDIRGEVGWIKHRLGAAFAVAEIDEKDTAEVALGMDPAGQGDGLARVFGAEFVAVMRAFHVVWPGRDEPVPRRK
jgi:SH3-like domain-containing protein